jgi:hypothetical protein
MKYALGLTHAPRYTKGAGKSLALYRKQQAVGLKNVFTYSP